MTSSPRKHPYNSSSGWLIATFGAIALGTGLRHGSALAGALGIAVLAACAAVLALARLGARGISLERIAPASVFEGEEVEVRLILRNGSRFPLFFPRVTELFTPAGIEKTAVFPYRIPAGETAEEAYRADCLVSRGVYRLGPLSLTVSDPFGWFQVERSLGEVRAIKVYPRYRTFGIVERIGDSLSLISRHLARFGLGESAEFFSVREYRIGDPLRRVHWPLTAHRGYPVVREYTRSATGSLCIFLDLYRYALLGLGRGSSLEQSVKIAAALSARAIERGHRVKLLGKGSREVRAGSGGEVHQVQEVLDALVEVKPDGEVPLDEYLDVAARRVSPGSIAVLMLSPYLRGSRKLDAHLTSLRRSGSRVILAVFDDSTFHGIYEPAGSSGATSAYMARMARIGMEPLLIPCAGNLPAIFSGRRAEGAGKAARA